MKNLSPPLGKGCSCALRRRRVFSPRENLSRQGVPSASASKSAVSAVTVKRGMPFVSVTGLPRRACGTFLRMEQAFGDGGYGRTRSRHITKEELAVPMASMAKSSSTGQL